MSFFKARPPREQQLGSGQLLLPVGWHAYVDAPSHVAVATVRVDGEESPNDLRDGQEVEILGWRPRTLDGIRYQIRRLSDGREWWIRAVHLRKAALEKVLPAVVPTARSRSRSR